MQIFSNSIGASVLPSPQPEDAGSTSGAGSTSSAASTNSATISANDFLELLVSELKNQDPTADTDPNEYINQLVQVNSLEQLISINQDLTPASSSSAGTGSGTGSDTGSGTGDVANQTPGSVAPQTGAAVGATTGNLSAPNAVNTASRIANSLEKAALTLAPTSPGGSLDSVISSMRARAQQARPFTSNPAR